MSLNRKLEKNDNIKGQHKDRGKGTCAFQYAFGICRLVKVDISVCAYVCVRDAVIYVLAEFVR